MIDKSETSQKLTGDESASELLQIILKEKDLQRRQELCLAIFVSASAFEKMETFKQLKAYDIEFFDSLPDYVTESLGISKSLKHIVLRDFKKFLIVLSIFIGLVLLLGLVSIFID